MRAMLLLNSHPSYLSLSLLIIRNSSISYFTGNDKYKSLYAMLMIIIVSKTKHCFQFQLNLWSTSVSRGYPKTKRVETSWRNLLSRPPSPKKPLNLRHD